MQTIAPVDVHVGNTWREALTNATTTKKSTNVNQRPTRQAPKMRTCVTAKTKVTKAKSHPTVQTIGQTKTTTTATSTVAATTAAVATGVPARSRSPSPPTRDPWYVTRQNDGERELKNETFSSQGSTTRSINQRTKIQLAGNFVQSSSFSSVVFYPSTHFDVEFSGCQSTFRYRTNARKSC